MKAMDRMLARRRFGMKPGLEIMEAMLTELGHPQQAFGCVHVAGTNGKGSVCAMVAAVLQSVGIRTGLYTSPHLVRLNERFRVDGVDLPDDELSELVERVEAAADKVGGRLGRGVTFFECSTAIAFEYFRRRGVQVGVIETGLGGRLDATNVIIPLVAVITRISLEHMEYLGTTIEEIASEKAGIIKAGRPVVCGAMPEAALEVVRKTAAARGAPLRLASATVSVARAGMREGGQAIRVSSEGGSCGTVCLPLLGDHQLENLATALTAVGALEEILGVEFPAKKVRAGLAATRWAGRGQVLSRDPLVILDGAHNPGGAEALAELLRRQVGHRPVALVFGACADKDVAGVLRALAGAVRLAWTVTIRNDRALAAGDAARMAQALGIPAQPAALADALEAATAWARAHDGAVCIAGSLFLAGEVLERLAAREEQITAEEIWNSGTHEAGS